MNLLLDLVIKINVFGDSRAADRSLIAFIKLCEQNQIKYLAPVLISMKQEKFNNKEDDKEDFFSGKIKFSRILELIGVTPDHLQIIKDFDQKSGIGIEIKTKLS